MQKRRRREIDPRTYDTLRDVILSEAKNLGSEMFRFAQHDSAVYEVSSNHAS
jgi:hypothetical protein